MDVSAAPGGPVLALDSSTAVGSVAVGEQGRILAEISLRVEGGHSSALLPAVDQALEAARLRPRDLAAIVVGGGPGSFTGLRVAAATAKGITHALEIPLFAYSGLLATAAGVWTGGSPVYALFDARKRDVYAACYRVGGRRAAVEVIFGPAALTLDAVLERFRAGEGGVFAGDGAWAHHEEIERVTGVTVAPPHLSAPRAASLVWLAFHAPELGRVPDAASWEPDYVRASGAERIAAELGAVS